MPALTASAAATTCSPGGSRASRATPGSGSGPLRRPPARFRSAPASRRPGPRYHPALIAQAWATLETMFPGRPYLGFGSGESLNESPLGAEWPPVGKQIERMEEALEMIDALFEGKRLSGQRRALRDRRRLPAHESGPPAADLRLRLRPAGRRGGRALGRRALDPGGPREGAGDPRRLPHRGRRRRPRAGRGPAADRVLVGRGRQMRRWRVPASGRAPSPTSSTPTIGTTRRRCTRRASASSQTTI